jgi:hypothetical protein
MMTTEMQTETKELFDRALAEGVRMLGERHGFDEADGAIILPTLEAALEVLPPPHRHFVQEHLDYYRRRFAVMEKAGVEVVLLAWSLEEPLVWAAGLKGAHHLELLPWLGKRPLREGFRDAPLLTRREALRQIAHILRAEGFTPQEEPVLLRPETEELVEAVAARLRVLAEGRSLEGTARLLVERSLLSWKEEGESPQAVAVVDVGGPMPVMLAFDDPRPLVWEGAEA